VPTIALLLFAAVDLLLALILLIGDGFTFSFVAIAAIGLLLAGLGLSRVWRRTGQ
jgi:hypothetical protein